MNAHFSYTLVTAPAEEPISRAQAKLHLRVDDGDTSQDAIIDALIVAARRWCEQYTGRALVQQTWDLRLDRVYGEIQIGKVPVQSVTSVSYIDTDGNTQTLSTTLYDVDVYSEPARITKAFDEVWPDYRAVPNAWTVRFIAGYAIGSPADYAQNIPGELLAAMKLVIGHLYENREQVIVGGVPQVVPMGAEYLAHCYRTQFI